MTYKEIREELGKLPRITTEGSRLSRTQLQSHCSSLGHKFIFSGIAGDGKAWYCCEVCGADRD